MSIKPVESYARVGCLSYVYAEAVEKGYSEYLKYSIAIKKFGEVEYDEELEELRHLQRLSGLQAIVFSAMCFEAAIFDFASVHLGDDYVKDHLDKLDTLSKWVVVLRFVSGIELQKSDSPYGLLKTLIITRNKLVHAKSEEFEFEPERQIKQFEKMKKREEDYDAGVHNAFRALVTMSLYLEQTQNGYHNPLPSFSRINAPMRRYYSDLQGVIAKCHQTVKKLKLS